MAQTLKGLLEIKLNFTFYLHLTQVSILIG